MTETEYRKLTGWFRENPKRIRWLHITARVTSAVIFLSYILLLAWDFAEKDPRLLRNLLVPMISFIAVSAFRYRINRKRPYEAFGLPPVLPKDKKGKSFPSRHTFSAFMIAMTVLLSSPARMYGGFLLVLSVGIGMIRVLAGVHYPSDVIAGTLIGVIAGITGFCIL